MTVSPAMQRYAAEIYRLQQDYEQVPLSLLSEHVDASAQAISTMVKRLNKNGFLTHEPYKGVRLTSDGEKIAMPSLRRHRLTEVFLVKVMKYDWATAHELADTFKDEPLVNVPSGSECIVSRVRTHDSDKLRYIAEIGLVPGKQFHLLSCAPFKGPLRLEMKPHDHIIGYELSQSLWVEVIKKGEGNKPPPLKTPLK